MEPGIQIVRRSSAKRIAHMRRIASIVRTKSRQKSRVTNDKALLPDIDGRSSAARRYRDLVGAFIADMGGPDQCGDIKLGLLRRLAAVTVQAEVLEARMVNGEPVDVATLCQLASTAMRLSARLGLERVPKNVTTTLGDMLREDLRRQGGQRP